MKLIRTTSDNLDFKYLTHLFDEYLTDIDGDQKDFFAHYNNKYLAHVLVIYKNGQVVGCGGFKEYNQETAEIKRMFVHPDQRKKGIATLLLNEIEKWANEYGYQKFILETSPKLKNAISLYKKLGYYTIPNFGQYIGIKNSICMKKS
ncbi:GNAT family N-acetyltransferase [Flavobacterium columnare]|uniref:GNAT family N-acetyltransferase n=1 Tax=Flavobacterium columnare TaxID=996 RepID=UPI0013D8BED6|nr:GNAT family N-acetyltransferase [Flavobacterium columnare]